MLNFRPFGLASLDVLAELDDGTQVIIEIQVAKQLEFLKRLWVYICNQVSKNMDTIRLQLGRTSPIYSDLIPVYSVSILEKIISTMTER